MAKKLKTVHQPFESAGTRTAFTKIARDMMDSKAWEALNLRQRGLYLYMKAKYKPKASYGVVVKSNADDISVPADEMKKLYGDLSTFRKDIDMLIACGFIRLISSGRFTRTPNIYGFSARWQQYGEPGYTVPLNELRIQPRKELKV